MTDRAENKALQPAETYHHERLKKAVTEEDWIAAGDAVDRLRLHGWRYARLAAEFGAERWESIAQEIDEAESSE